MDQIRAEQQQMIDDQDRGLDELSKALRRQQQMGLDMQDEIQEHNGICTYTCISTWYSHGKGSLKVLFVWYRVIKPLGMPIPSFSVENAVLGSYM